MVTSQSYEPTDQDLEAGPPPHERAGVVTFATLNKSIKVNPAPNKGRFGFGIMNFPGSDGCRRLAAGLELPAPCVR